MDGVFHKVLDELEYKLGWALWDERKGETLNKSADGMWTVRCVKYQMRSIGDTSITDLLSMNLQQKLKMVKNQHSPTMPW